MGDASRQVEALADAALDGPLAPADEQRLYEAMERDPAFAHRVAQALAVEGVLRSSGRCPDVTDRVLEAIAVRELPAMKSVEAAVMRVVTQNPRWQRPSVRRATRSGRFALLMIAALLGCAMAAVVWREAMAPATKSMPRPPRRENTRPSTSERLPPRRAHVPTDSPLPAPPTPARQAPSLPEDRLFRFDFEQGILPPEFEQGLVVMEGDDGGSRYAIQGTFNAWAPRVSSVFLNPGRTLFVFETGLLLRFRCLAKAHPVRVRIQMFDGDQRQNHQFDVPQVEPDRWTTIEVPLDNLRPVLNIELSMKPGDHIENLFIMAGGFWDQPVLIDDVELVRRNAPSVRRSQ